MKWTVRDQGKELEDTGEGVIPLDVCGQLEHSHCCVNGRKKKSTCKCFFLRNALESRLNIIIRKAAWK